MRTAHIVGKGTTAKYMKHGDYKEDIFVAVNHAAIFMDRIDYLFANDVEGLEGIPDEVFSRVKTLAIPFHPHINGKPKESLTHEYILEKYKKFNLEFLVYNLHTWSIQDDRFITPEFAMTTSGMAFGYVVKYHDIKNFQFYGVANGGGYHPDISRLLPETNKVFEKNWKPRRLGDLRHTIEQAAKKYQASVKFN